MHRHRRYAAWLCVGVGGALGVYGCVCPPGTIPCDESCMDVSSDNSNCGGCRVSCGTAEVCYQGRCVFLGNCMRAADCDDGDYCNGRETCDRGYCASGVPPCDDHVACTQDSCDGVGCSHVPDDSLCGADEMCTPTGCASMCVGEPCNPVTGSECPGCNCVYDDGQPAARCVAARGSGEVETHCTESADCAAGLVCINVDSRVGSSYGLCLPVCEGEGDCAPYGRHRADGNCFRFAATDPYGHCTSGCDPFYTSGVCPYMTVCRPLAFMRTFTGQCMTPNGTGRAGDRCSSTTDCAATFICINYSDGVSQCEKMCRTTSDCVSGRTCYPTTAAGVGFCGYS